MKKRALQRAVLLLSTIITWGLLSACRGASKEEVVAPVVTVDVAPVLNAEIQRVIRTQALIYPLQQAAIAPKISAPIKKIYVEKGATVRAGQLLVELENQDIVGALKESQAAKALADATFATTAGATVPEETQKAELDVQAAKTALDAQQAIFDSRQSLYKEGAIAQKDVNEAQVNLTQARNQYEIARQSPRQLSALRQGRLAQGGRRSARSGVGTPRRHRGAIELLADYESHRRRGDRPPAVCG